MKKFWDRRKSRAGESKWHMLRSGHKKTQRGAELKDQTSNKNLENRDLDNSGFEGTCVRLQKTVEVNLNIRASPASQRKSSMSQNSRSKFGDAEDAISTRASALNYRQSAALRKVRFSVKESASSASTTHAGALPEDAIYDSDTSATTISTEFSSKEVTGKGDFLIALAKIVIPIDIDRKEWIATLSTGLEKDIDFRLAFEFIKRYEKMRKAHTGGEISQKLFRLVAVFSLYSGMEFYNFVQAYVFGQDLAFEDSFILGDDV
ncbi:hypothetical protein RUND412_011495 [Rhizina undulata]